MIDFELKKIDLFWNCINEGVSLKIMRENQILGNVSSGQSSDNNFEM